MRHHRIPAETIRRLPIYLRALLLSSGQGQKRISSQELAELLGIYPWQIRKDFSFFGGLGKRGVGYDIGKLVKDIKKILRLDTIRKAALVGVGNLGSAILAYPGFKIYGFDIAVAFDCDPKKIGREIKGVQIEDITNLSTLRMRKIDLGIIAVPRDVAQQTANAMVKAGVKGILNFSPCYITVPEKIKVITIDIAMDLARLPYYMPIK
ncbi:MAG: redox-sensing transcriptional repressor Rex [Planctomycetes bacterium RBG_13_44_8b]|nr:MAG: redox-sensing transcriptional repressor Rex [Planctomycetes bacterium RBG_13_44_8b]